MAPESAAGAPFKLRLAAILAADAAGYSRLMAVDEHATVAALDDARTVFRTKIESNYGRVIDMAGDSVLAVFDTATAAVSTAMAIQNELLGLIADVPEDRRMRFRIGVHLGDVIEKSDGSVYGDGVNIASRLEGLAEPGGITVSESIRTAVKAKINASFEDQGEQSVKNIAEPVRAYRVKSGAEGTPSPNAGASEIDLSLPDKPSIAVLAFTNMSGDPEQEYFTDGITEDIITELSRFKSLFVIARNSSFTYKGKPVDVRTVAKDLGVRYVLEGSIRKAANRIRITGQLIDALTGNHIWAEKYDRTLEDVFEVQEELTRSIVASIAPQIDVAEWKKANRRSSSMNSYELALRARSDADAAYFKSDTSMRDRAIRGAHDALATDPENTLALSAFSFAYWQHVYLGTGADLEDCWRHGQQAAQRIVEIDPADSRGYFFRACHYIVEPWKPGLLAPIARIDEALHDLRRAHALNPNDVLTTQVLAYCEASAGDTNRAVEHLTQVLRYSPRDPHAHNTLSFLSFAHYLARDYSNGISFGLRATRDAPQMFNAHLILLCSYVGAGRLQEARASFMTARSLAPRYVEAMLEGYSRHPDPQERHRQTVFLRIAAGLEDPSAAESLR